MSKYKVAEFSFGMGYISDLPVTEGRGYMRNGSQNAMVTGAGEIKAFEGLTKLGIEGAKVNFLADNGFAGLGSASQTASGNIFRAIDLLLYIGQGDVIVNGVNTNKLATTTLSYLQRDTNGKYSSSSESYQVGLPRPSTPTTIVKTVPSAGIKRTTGSIVLSIWRISDTTGQPSLPSPVTDVIELSNGSVLVQFPEASSNNQDYWGVGVPRLGLRELGAMYQLPDSSNGLVAEADLSYSRVIEGCSIPDTSSTLTITDTDTADQFTASDVGRRFTLGSLDTYITAIASATEATLNDSNDTGSALSGDGTVIHAIDGYPRTVEIGYSDDDLFGQPFTPVDAFEPPDGNFAGLLYDTFFIEDTAGTIFYSIPNFFSFPKSKRKIFTDEIATVYLDSGDGIIWRLSNQTVSTMQYIGGEAPILLDVKSKNVGCKYPQNATLGYKSRVLFWGGSPHVMSSDGQYDDTFYLSVGREFEGWEAQVAEIPVVTGFDPVGKYECWMYGRKIMAFHAPSSRWCSPIDVTEWVGDDNSIVGSFIKDERLHLVVKDADLGTLAVYIFNSGSGSTMKLVSHTQKMEREQVTVTEVKTTVKVGSSLSKYNITAVKNFVHDIPEGYKKASVDDSSENRLLESVFSNIKGVERLSLVYEIENAIGYATVDLAEVYGEGNRVSSRGAE